MQQFEDLGVEILLKNPDDFLKTKETLTRIGIASRKEKKLFQSCHILHKKGKYRILHFKEMFILDHRPSTLSEDDKGRRNTIVNLLDEWGLVEIVDKNVDLYPTVQIGQIKILPFHEKNEWSLVPKYKMGFFKN